MNIIALELRKLGLTEKEARVYLTGLEFGPTSVQKISLAANLTRPTTYEIIKKLEEKGLFLEIKEKKKRYFVAQSPEGILGMLKTQKKEIEEKEREFIRIIAILEAKYSKGELRLYKEKEGMDALKEILSFASTPNILIINPKQNNLKDSFKLIKIRLGKINLKEKTIKLKGSLIIFDKVIFISEKKKEGYLIDNPIIVEMLKSLFLAI